MKVMIIHDDAGTIRGTLLVKAKDLNAAIKPLGGLRTHIMEIENLSTAEQHKKLADIHHNHRVNLLAKEPVLVPKKSTTKK